MDPIEDYYRLYEEYDQLFHQENDLLQSDSPSCTTLFLEKKAKMLESLEESVSRLKTMCRDKPNPDPVFQKRIQKCQNKLLQLFYLDRENERLWLKQNSLAKKTLKPAVSAKKLNESYGN